MLGVYPIEAEIYKRKLMFFGKLCNLGLGTLSKQIFLHRLHDFIAKAISCFFYVLRQFKILKPTRQPGEKTNKL
jgi:hypothetical protein